MNHPPKTRVGEKDLLRAGLRWRTIRIPTLGRLGPAPHSAALGLAGLWLGLLLWSLAFITVGGEWFLMWESPVWNGEFAVLRGFLLNAVLIVFLRLPEDDHATFS